MKRAFTSLLSLILFLCFMIPTQAAEDRFANPTPLIFQDVQGKQKATVSSKLDGQNRFDFYKLILDENKTVNMTLSGLNGEAVAVLLKSSDENKILKFDDNYTKASSITQYVSLEKGEYIIEINLQYSHEQSNYTLDVLVDNVKEFTEIEPNNTLEKANYLPLNTAMNANAHVTKESTFHGGYPTWEADFYKIEIPITQKYGIKYTGDLLPRMSLYNQNGDFITSLYQAETLQLTPGTYFLKVEHSVNNQGDYRIEVDTLKFADVNLSHWAVKEIAYLSDLSIITGHKDGTFKPNDYVTKGQAAAMIVRALGLDTTNRPATSYKDIANHWANKDIRTLVDEGIISNGTTFNPNANLTRAEMAAMIVKAYTLTGVSSMEFLDVPKSSANHRYISSLAANNITTGYSDRTFKPNNPLTRAEFSAFLSRTIDERYKQ